MSNDVLSRRALNRATLARQLLLDRADLGTEAALEHLVGMQAQAPNAPYVGLWTRRVAFAPDELARSMLERRAVRVPLMRGTIHLVTARDCIALRAVVRPVLEHGFRTGSPFGPKLAGMDFDALLIAGRQLLEERPRTRAEFGPLLAERWPDRDVDSLAYALTYLVPLVQVPPRGIWGKTGPAAWTTAESWLGRALSTERSPDDMVLRYLAAFGPASVMDAQSWSGLTRLNEVFDRLRPQLQSFRDEQGKALFDLPEAPRPDAETPAPPRFLPEYDNVQFAHADRSRILIDNRRPPLFPGNGGRLGTVLFDGFVRGTWSITDQHDRATLTIEPSESLPTADMDALVAEGATLLSFVTGTESSTSAVRVRNPA